MKCVILVAGHGTLLESEIRHHGPRNLVGIPKSLLPGVGTKKILDSWWNCLNQKHIFTDVFLVTNADKYKVVNLYENPPDLSRNETRSPKNCSGTKTDLLKLSRGKKRTLQDCSFSVNRTF